MFRYPGGKLRLGKKIDEEIKSRWPEAEESSWVVLDGFVGGGGSLINMARDFPNWTFYINDLSSEMYQFWSFFANADSEEVQTFCDRVEETVPTLSMYNIMFASKPSLPIDAAFRTLFLNKTSFNGFVTRNTPIGGKKQTGKWKVGAYWTPKNIVKGVRGAKSLLSGRILGVSNHNVLNTLNGRRKYDFVYLDPPYMRHGEDWYGKPFGPEELTSVRKALSSQERWAVSMDDTEDTRKIFSVDKRIPVKVRYSARSAVVDGKISESTELVVFPND